MRYCPCPPVRDWCCRVCGLVFLHSFSILLPSFPDNRTSFSLEPTIFQSRPRDNEWLYFISSVIFWLHLHQAYQRRVRDEWLARKIFLIFTGAEKGNEKVVGLREFLIESSWKELRAGRLLRTNGPWLMRGWVSTCGGWIQIDKFMREANSVNAWPAWLAHQDYLRKKVSRGSHFSFLPSFSPFFPADPFFSSLPSFLLFHYFSSVLPTFLLSFLSFSPFFPSVLLSFLLFSFICSPFLSSFLPSFPLFSLKLSWKWNECRQTVSRIYMVTLQSWRRVSLFTNIHWAIDGHQTLSSQNRVGIFPSVPPPGAFITTPFTQSKLLNQGRDLLDSDDDTSPCSISASPPTWPSPHLDHLIKFKGEFWECRKS